MADHAVHRVDRLVGEQPRQAEQQIPEGRRNHAVGIILGAALDRRSGDAVLIEGAYVPADDVAHRSARAGSAAGIEGPRHPHHVVGHGALREQHRDQRELDEPAPAESGRLVGDEPAGGGAHTHDQQHRNRAEEHAGGHAQALPIEGAVEETGEPAHQADGMREPARVADKRVEREGAQEDERHPRADRPVGRGEEEHRPTMKSPRIAVNGWNGGGR